MPSRLLGWAIGTALAASVAWLAPAAGQGTYPDRPIRMIVPQAPGSATDLLARSVSAEAERILNQKIIIENKPGAAFTIGLDLVARAAPDGYTLGMGPVGALAISPNMVAKLPYDVLRDFQPVVQLTRGHLLVAVAPNSSIHSIKELIAEAKKYPGKLTNASSASGSPGHVAAELFKVLAGVNIVHVPYRGGAAAMNDLIAGHVQVMFESLNSMAPHARTGAVRGLAVSGSRRSPMFPDLPTVAEAGVPGYDAPTWQGIVGPARMPRAIVMRLNEAFTRALTSPEYIERFGKIGDEAAGGPPEAFGQTIRVELAKWADVVKRSGAKLE
jgi:tripartite-type tricarboxylate transporter receptor subunit TctC